MGPVIACQKSGFFLVHHHCERVVVFVAKFLCVGLVDVFCVGANVACVHCLSWLCCGADRHMSVCCLVLPCSFSSTLPPWQRVAFDVSHGAEVIVGRRVVFIGRFAFPSRGLSAWVEPIMVFPLELAGDSSSARDVGRSCCSPCTVVGEASV